MLAFQGSYPNCTVIKMITVRITQITVRNNIKNFLVTNLKLNNSLVTVIEGNIADIIRGMPNYAAKGFTIEGNVSLARHFQVL